jgi:hypothetical protein
MALNVAQYEPVNRETVWAGLFAWLESQLLSTATPPGPFASMGRKHKPPPELVIADQPCLFQVAVKEVHIPQRVPGAPTKLVLKGFLIVYAFDNSPDEDIGSETVLPETTMNNLLLAIDQCFVPDSVLGKFTIGGLAQHCWIEGDADLDPGIFGPQCAAILPLNILV